MRMNRGAIACGDLRRRLRLLGVFIWGLTVVSAPPVLAQFVSQGPVPLEGGGVDGMGAQSSPVSGAIEAVAPHPATVGTLLIGGVNGGIWRTTDATAASPSWTSVSDSGSISDIKYDLSDGASMTLLAGIGRTSAFAGIGSDRNGLLRSTDDGATWSAITTLTGNPNVRAVEPRGANLVVGIDAAESFSCGDIGLFHSADTGATFTQRVAGLSFDVTANPLTAGAGTTEMFASVDDNGCGGTDGIHRSDDSGATWTKVSTAAMDTEINGARNVAISVGRQGSAGTDANVYVAICNAAAAGKLSSLWRSPDSGTTWTAMTLPMTTATVPQDIHPGSQCSPHLSLQADPTNHNVVYIGGDRQPDNNEETGIPADPQFPNSHGASNYSGQLHRVDAAVGGALSNPITHCLTTTPASCALQSSVTMNTAPHADSRDMGFDAAGNLIQSDDGGVYRRTTPIGTGNWSSVVGNLEVNEAHDAAYDPISKSIISGMQDNSNGDRDGVLPGTATTWTSRDSGDGGDVGVGVGDPSATESTRYSSAQNLGGLARRVYNNTNVLQSTAFPALAPGGDPAMVAQFITPLAVNSITPTRIIFGGSNGVYESADRGDTIAQINMDDMEETLNFVYGTTGNADFLAYSRDADRFVCIRTAADPAAPTCTDTGATANPVDIVVDPQDATRLVAVTPSQVFETSNGGTTWTNVTGDLLTTNAAGELFSAELIRTATRLALLVGTRNGVFFDPNGLAGAFGTYGALSTGLGKAPVYDLQYNAADDRLMVGTLGRGAYTLDSAMATVPIELISFEIQ